MASDSAIKDAVAAFFREHGQARRLEDAFAPWVLHSRFHVAPQEALAQSSDGNYDSGIDGYHLEHRDMEHATLSIIQAKFSDKDVTVRKGLDDLGRALGLVERFLTTQWDSDLASENQVVRSLRLALAELSETARSTLVVKGILVHLLPDQAKWLGSPAVSRTKNELIERLANGVLAGRARIEYLGPGPGPESLAVGDVVPTQAPPLRLEFSGVDLEHPGGRVLLGYGKLADLVALHEKYQVDLFAKNVRMYLSRQAKKEQSAAYQIRKSLEQVCAGKQPAVHFALAHNGVTISCARANQSCEDRTLTLEPGSKGVYVLNGCQTVYTASTFLKDFTTRKESPSSAWLATWKRIPIPLRIVTTHDEDLVRRITISTNRQTSIEPSAFWAHDQTQLDIDERLARYKIHYERQKEAWDHLNRVEPNRAAEYGNGSVGLEDVARALAAATRGLRLELARSPHNIFDNEEQYRRVFSAKATRSVLFLVFLDNLYRATKGALSDITNDAEKYVDLKPTPFLFPVYRLLVHWVAKKQPDFVTENCTKTFNNNGLREEAKRFLGHHHSGIQQLLASEWCEDGEWQDPMDKVRLDRCFSKLRLDAVDPFETFANLDAEVAKD